MIPLLFCLIGLSHAEEVPTLGFQETLRLVIENNPDRKSAELAEEIAAIEARRARLDRFSAEVSATGGADAGVVKPWDEDLFRTTDANWDARVSVGMPLYAGGSVRARIDQADAGAQVATINRTLTERNLIRAAYTAYWNIKGYELQIAASEEGLQLTQQALDIIIAKANAGLAAGIDVNRSKVDLYSQQESLVAQKAALYRAEQELLRLLNLPGDHLILTDDPPPVGAASAVAGTGEARPELAQKEQEAAQAEAEVRLARAGTLPTVSVVATAGVGSSTTGTSAGGDLTAFDAANLAPTVDASVGLRFSWNLFDLFQTRDRVAQAQASAQQVSASTESEKASIQAEIRQAASTLRQLQERAPLVDAQVSLARDNLQIVQALYAQGSATILDLFNAQASFRQARTQGASLQVDLAIAADELRWLSGEDLIGAAQ